MNASTERKGPATATHLWPVLGNYWHPVALAESVGTKPIAVQLLDERLVVCRLEERFACFKDLCIHRGAALSCGWVDGKHLVCGYHGWRYDASGTCVRIPSRPDRPIPKRARTQSYHCQEQYGIVWVCLGKPRAPVPELPEWDDPSFNRHFIGPLFWKCSAARAAENFTDLGHFAWVHQGILGDPEHPEVPDFEINREGEELRYQYVDRPNEVHPTEQTKIFRLFRPFSVHRRLIREGSDHVEVLYYSITPHSSRESTQYLYVLRNFELEPGEFEKRRKLTELVMEQDRVIVENQRPEELPLDLSEELHIKGPDEISIAYRRFLAELDVT